MVQEPHYVHAEHMYEAWNVSFFPPYHSMWRPVPHVMRCRIVCGAARAVLDGADGMGRPPLHSLLFLKRCLIASTQIKNAKLKWGVATTIFVTAGFGLPVVAIQYSKSKTMG